MLEVLITTYLSAYRKIACDNMENNRVFNIIILATKNTIFNDKVEDKIPTVFQAKNNVRYIFSRKLYA